jgi:hypothetical protein
MTDLEQFKELLDNSKIVYEHVSSDAGTSVINIYAGYIGFFTEVVFSEEGVLIAIGAYEG